MSTNLRVARERFTKLNQEDVAKELGISLSAYQKYEQGQRALRGDTLVKLVRILGVSSDTILGTDYSEMADDSDFLNDDERALIDDYRALDDQDKSIVRRIASALNS